MQRYFCGLVWLLLASLAGADPGGKWGLIERQAGAFEGYTLIAPLKHTVVYLLDMDGRVVHTWDNGLLPGNSVRLLPDGRLLRATSVQDNKVFGAPNFGGGRLQILNWDGELEWDYRISDDKQYQHHDITPMPNGNVLALAWDHRSKEEAIAAGRPADQISRDQVWPEMVLEVKPTGPTSGEVVWEWRLWDHLVQNVDPSKENYGVVADHPGRLDLNCVPERTAPDWNHGNSIDYNPELDQILLDFRVMSELYVIDHSTTTEEARGKAGDFLYRWGNPRMYGRGDESDQTLFSQHHPHWIEPGLPGAGNILVFNNGNARPGGDSSSVDEVRPPLTAGAYQLETGEAFGPEKAVWSYAADPKSDFYSHFISGSQRLPNGNTLICSGAWSRVFEVTPEGKIVWEYRASYARPDAPKSEGGMLEEGAPMPGRAQLQGYGVFRATRYAPDHPGLAGRELRPVE